ncbi:hypothetical protein Droror1_Dr00023923 [Drosera rotundifolia]
MKTPRPFDDAQIQQPLSLDHAPYEIPDTPSRSTGRLEEGEDFGLGVLWYWAGPGIQEKYLSWVKALGLPMDLCWAGSIGGRKKLSWAGYTCLLG